MGTVLCIISVLTPFNIEKYFVNIGTAC